MGTGLRSGSRIGKYRLVRRLGEGASAIVWHARDTIEGRAVALKVFSPSVVEEFGREAVEAEARLAAQLEHPRIASIRNADWIDGRFVIATSLARESLDQVPTRRLTGSLALSILSDISEALAYAHAAGVIHRDIKPANILLDGSRRAMLADFGTARLAPARTVAATEVGTFGYMAPEQAYGRPGFASDVFSLSLTAYESLAGVLPCWPFEWPLEGDARFRKRCPPPVGRVLRRGLALDLDRRISDGVAFRRALLRSLEEVRRVERPNRSQPAPRRRRKTPVSDPFELERDWFRKRYGREFETHFDCHACDGPISESMTFCPWCGSNRNSFAEITSFPLVCPDCERGVRPEWSACPTCSRGRFVANGRPIPRGSTAERYCGRHDCGAPIHRFMRYCPACKKKVVRPWRVDGLKGCRRCAWPVAPRWRFCAWCGKRNGDALQVHRPRA